MAREDFIPRQDALFISWHDQFKAAVLANAVTFGLVAGDTTPITNDNTDIHAKYAALLAAQAAFDNALNGKNLSRVSAEARVRALIKRIKSHPAYSPAWGGTFQIIGAENATDLHTSAPVIKGRDLGAGHCEVQFAKKTASGVNVYCKRGTESTFTFLAHDTQSPYIDTRPLLDPTKPELRAYRMKFMDGDTEVGNFSEELVVNCAP
ncbi:MAG: hypothetical protein ACXWKG_10770 [Limisphaerales bacterium]